MTGRVHCTPDGQSAIALGKMKLIDGAVIKGFGGAQKNALTVRVFCCPCRRFRVAKKPSKKKAPVWEPFEISTIRFGGGQRTR